jgi:hypothetical protein
VSLLFAIGSVLVIVAFTVVGWRFDHIYREAYRLRSYWSSAKYIPTRAMWRSDPSPKVERARRMLLGIVTIALVWTFVIGPIISLLRVW